MLVTVKQGKNALREAANKGNPDIPLRVCDWAQYILIKEKIHTNLLLATNNEVWFAWHYAVHEGNLYILLNIWGGLKGN